MNWTQTIVSILSGLAVCIPLVIKLVEYVSKAVKDKNWDKIVTLAIQYMTEAENKFTDGATRKEWVMGMIQASAKNINYDLAAADIANISDMIDKMCNMAKTVNAEAQHE